MHRATSHGASLKKPQDTFMTNIPLTMVYLICGIAFGCFFSSGFRASHIWASIIAVLSLLAFHVGLALATGSGYLAFVAIGFMAGIFGVSALFTFAPIAAKAGRWLFMIGIGFGCALIGLMTLFWSEGSGLLSVVDLQSQTVKKIWTEPHLPPYGLTFFLTPVFLALVYYFSLSKLCNVEKKSVL